MDFPIESGVPIPPKAVVVHARTRYPLELLKEGDSFQVPLDNAKKAKNLRNSLSARAKRLNIKITSVIDETGVRVWRTA